MECISHDFGTRRNSRAVQGLSDRGDRSYTCTVHLYLLTEKASTILALTASHLLRDRQDVTSFELTRANISGRQSGNGKRLNLALISLCFLRKNYRLSCLTIPNRCVRKLCGRFHRIPLFQFCPGRCKSSLFLILVKLIMRIGSTRCCRPAAHDS